MNKLLVGLIAASGAMVLATTSCSDDFNPSGDQEGRIFPGIDLNTQVVRSKSTSSSRVTAAEITSSDLALKIYKTDGSYQKEWASIDDFPTSTPFPVGDYIVEAYYGSLEEEGFDKPYYFGSASIAVEENKTTPVSVTASLANSMVTLEFSDVFRNYFAEYSTEVHSAGGAYLDYPTDETRPMYVRPGEVSVLIHVKKPNGTEATLQPASFTAEARHHYTLRFDVNGGEAGAGSLVLTYDDMTEREDVEIDLSDEILNAPAPEITTSGFQPGDVLDVVAGTVLSDPLRYMVIAKGGIESVTLTTKSVSLIEQGWPAEVDLVSADAATLSKLNALGLTMRGLSKPDKMAVVDLTNVISHIDYVAGADNETEFTLQVRDKYTKVCESPVSFKVNVAVLEFRLENPDVVYDGDEALTVDLYYNGSAATVASDVKIQLKNTRGTFSDLVVNSVTPVSGSENTYRLNVAIPADGDELILRPKVGNKVGEELTVTRTYSPYAVTVNANDVFAKSAMLGIDVASRSRAVELNSTPVFLLSTDGDTFSEVSASDLGSSRFKIASLKSATTYYARAIIDGIPTKKVSFTTETEVQLPNSDMESWNITATGDYWERWDVTGWATYNPMTTGNTGTRNKTAYVNRSGTAQSTDCHSGQYAAELRTIGWGSGNSAVGSISASNPKYITKGMLFLGSSPTEYSQLDSQVKQGTDFASRPSSVSFWYKYSPKNENDYGGMTVWVKDAAGTVIASGSQSNLNAREYTQVTVPLSYVSNAAKAAQIYIEFSSSDHPDYATRDKSWFTVPNFGNLSDGTFQGSSMFVDDIILNY